MHRRLGAIFGKSTNSVVCTGSAQSSLFQQGVDYANGEFIQVHPTSIPGEDKLRLMSESARGEGGRVWVPRTAGDKRPIKQIPESERFYFLEEWYPKYGNLVPRDVATRAIITANLDAYAAHEHDDRALSSLDFQSSINLLKVEASELAVETVMSAMRACGLAGYRNDGEFSIGRLLRDVLSSPIMINNDRILSNIASASLMSAVPASLRD